MSTQQLCRRPIAWSIAGSDSGGGAGIQADLLTFHDFDVHGCTVITASTAQNSVSITDVLPAPAAHVQQQLETLAADLLPSVIKIGMLANAEIVDTVCDFLDDFDGIVIYDPVLQSSTGGSLFDDIDRSHLQRLLARIDLLTPNIPEAEWLTGKSIQGPDEMESAARHLQVLGCKAVLLTGGHAVGAGEVCRDYFCSKPQNFWLTAQRVDTPHSHGSGCTLSAAIAAAMATGLDLDDALVVARAYVVQGIRAAAASGKGAGAVAHVGFPSRLEDYPGIVKSSHGIAAQPVSRFSFASCGSSQLGLYPVVDSVDWITRLLSLGVKTIQLRVKSGSAQELDQQVAAAVAVSEKYRARLFINDYWQLAIKHGAYGVHLGQEDLGCADLSAISQAGLRLGISTHSWWEIARAHAIRPSYIAIGPIYETTTKQMRFQQQGIGQLTQWVNLLKQDYPIVAIGGIDYERSKSVLESGVGSIAMVSAITGAKDYVEEVKKLLTLIDKQVVVQ